LDNRYDAAPTVIAIDRPVAPGWVPPSFFTPSVADLPAVAGIRHPPAAESAVYVLNEPQGPRTSMRRLSGPQIVERPREGESAWTSQPDAPFGARIIHLSVPVGARE
jgi:hypothetical protein